MSHANRKPPAARRTGAQQEKKAAFLEALRQRLSVSHAAQTARVGRRTVYEWREADAAFAEDWDEAREAAIDALEASAYEKAMGGDTTMQIFMLKCHRPQRYRDPPRGSYSAMGRAGTTGPTWGDIFTGAEIDITSEDAWKALVRRLGDMPVESAVRIAKQATDQVLKIRLLQQKGAGGQMLQEIRRMAQDLFGESAPVDERDDAEDDDR